MYIFLLSFSCADEYEENDNSDTTIDDDSAAV